MNTNTRMKKVPCKDVSLIKRYYQKPAFAQSAHCTYIKGNSSEAEFLAIIVTKVSSLLFTVTCTTREQKWFDMKLVCNVNIVYGNIKSENSQDYTQKPQRNWTFTNSAPVFQKQEEK
jgi:hypothetical protein